MLQKIISGGQTGADQGALDAALKFDFSCGGTAPNNFKDENGLLPEKYYFLEKSKGGLKTRTKENIWNSDGTLIFLYEYATGGIKLTKELCKKYNKFYKICDLSEIPLNCNSLSIYNWLSRYKIKILNVAGPRESKFPGTQEKVEKILSDLITHVDSKYQILKTFWETEEE